RGGRREVRGIRCRYIVIVSRVVILGVRDARSRFADRRLRHLARRCRGLCSRLCRSPPGGPARAGGCARPWLAGRAVGPTPNPARPFLGGARGGPPAPPPLVAPAAP